MPRQMISAVSAAAAAEAAKQMGLPEGWGYSEHIPACGQKTRRFVDPEGKTYRSLKEVRVLLGDAFPEASFGSADADEGDEKITDDAVDGAENQTEGVTREGAACEGGEEGAESKTHGGRKGFRARLLGDLADTDPLEAIEKARERVLAEDSVIEAARAEEAAADAVMVEANRELQAVFDEVQALVALEVEAAAKVKAMELKRQEAAKVTAERRAALQQQQDFLVLLEMEFERRAALKRAAEEVDSAKDEKRRRLEELEQLAVDARKASEEHRQREKEAREAMKALLKEQKRCTAAIGPFGRRQRAARATASAAAAAEAEDPALLEPSQAQEAIAANGPASGPASGPQTLADTSADAAVTALASAASAVPSAADGLPTVADGQSDQSATAEARPAAPVVRVKREVMQAFAPRREALPLVVEIEDSQ